MSQQALEAYQKAATHQLRQNEARHIRTLVRQARQSPHLAAVRWPFELLQNALDAGPRVGRPTVTVRLEHADQRAVFEHDGAPFELSDLSALLSGGSSKDFAGEETTGRFGTGFLVTHVLAERASLEGILAVDAGFERFSLVLDRSGDEAAILENIERCDTSIGNAQLLASTDDSFSARFEYPAEGGDAWEVGVEAFRAALPFVFGTRPTLGDVSLPSIGVTERWTAAPVVTEEIPGGVLASRTIAVQTDGVTTELAIQRFGLRHDARGMALLLLKRVDGEWAVQTVERGAPRIYVQYPLRASTFVPVEYVLDARLDPDQERSRASMNPADREALSEAFGAAVVATRYSFDRGVADAHLLARVGPVESGFDATDLDEGNWWRQELQQFAESLARLPMVTTKAGVLPAIGPEDVADFIVPSLIAKSQADETSVERMWPLLEAVTELFPPSAGLAHDWSTIADGWHRLGVETSRFACSDLADFLRKQAATVTDLPVDGDPNAWMAGFLDVVGECWERRSGTDTSVLERLLPNQHGVLCSAGDLRRDVGVPSEVKDICEAAGLDVRAGLLSTDLDAFIQDGSLKYARSALEKAIPDSAGSDDVIRELLAHLRSRLPEDADCSEANRPSQIATNLLLNFLAASGHPNAQAVARDVPLITASGKVTYWGPRRLMMAPVGAWHEAARPFADAYPPDRVLDPLYLESEALVVRALDAWGIAHPDPITTATPEELTGPRLRAIVMDGFDAEGVTVRGETFSEIALLPTEVINHIQDADQAGALLGLVLCHIAPHDPTWRSWQTRNGWRSREPVEVPLRAALWLGDLLSRAWIPVPGEDQKATKAAADVSTIERILDPKWLEDNEAGIALLVECFGFDALELRLLGIDPETLPRIREGLARLLESAGADPEFYESLADEVEAKQRRQRDVERSRRMGYAVQEAVRDALQARGLDVDLVDRGYDYSVSNPSADNPLEDVAVRFVLGPYFVEVKATCTGPARLTALQAETAAMESARYVLCVVDLRGVTQERLDGAWTAADIEPLASMLGDIGQRISDTTQLVQRARHNAVGIRNEAALRYEVPPQAWSTGISIGDWVAAISADLQPRP